VLLSQYLKRGPRDLEFTFGRAGKPALPPRSRLRFNMSHSGGLAAYAFTLDCEIGIDIEEVRPHPDLERLPSTILPRGSRATAVHSGEEQRRGAFFRCWTRKGELHQAIGDGLSVPLDQFK